MDESIYLEKNKRLPRGLAKRLEGSGNQVQQNQSEVDGVPSLNIMDEYKYISVPGMSVAATQGRSLGLGIVGRCSILRWLMC